MSITHKDALKELASVTRKHAESLKGVAECLLASANALVLLAAAEDEVADSPKGAAAAPAAAETPAARKPRTPRAAATPTPPTAPAVTIDDLRAAAQELTNAHDKDKVIAVLQRHGVGRLSESKDFPKLLAELKAATGGADPEASDEDIYG